MGGGSSTAARRGGGSATRLGMEYLPLERRGLEARGRAASGQATGLRIWEDLEPSAGRVRFSVLLLFLMSLATSVPVSFFTCYSCTPHGRSMYILSCGSGSSELSLWIRECTSDPNPFEWRTFSLNSLGAL
jgi:hypothetical protein